MEQAPLLDDRRHIAIDTLSDLNELRYSSPDHNRDFYDFFKKYFDEKALQF